MDREIISGSLKNDCVLLLEELGEDVRIQECGLHGTLNRVASPVVPIKNHSLNFTDFMVG